MRKVIVRKSTHLHFPIRLIAQYSVRGQQLHPNLDFVIPVAIVNNLELDKGLDFLRRHEGCLAAQTIHAVCLGREIDVFHLDQPDRVVQPAVLVKIGGDRNQINVLPVVANNLDDIYAALQGLGDGDREGRVAASVGSHPDPVHRDDSGLGGSFEQEEARLRDIVDSEVATVIGLSAVVFAGVPVYSIPGVRDRNLLPSRTVFAELPLLEFYLTVTADLRHDGKNGNQDRRKEGEEKLFIHLALNRCQI